MPGANAKMRRNKKHDLTPRKIKPPPGETPANFVVARIPQLIVLLSPLLFTLDFTVTVPVES
jgi:hypothetical protein